MRNIVKDWYEVSSNIDEMSITGKLKKWEAEVVGRFPVGARILNVGCGMGREAFALADRGFSVTGIDISTEIIRRVSALARQKGYDIPFIFYDGRKLPFDKDTFDVVIIWSQTFGLLYGEQTKYDFLQECRRVTVQNGLLSFSAHDYAYLSGNYAKFIKENRFYPYANTELYWETFSPEQLTNYATMCGYKVIFCGSGEIYRPEDGTVLHCLCKSDS